MIGLPEWTIGIIIAALSFFIGRAFRRSDSAATEVVVLRVKVDTMQAELSALRAWRDDLTGFMQGLGFRRRGNVQPAIEPLPPQD